MTDLPVKMDTGLLLAAFRREAAGSAETAAFQRDARTFLKRLANALDLKPGSYSVSHHSGTMEDTGEAVLRCGRLLVVVTQDDARNLCVHSSCITPGETTAPEAIQTHDFRTLFTATGQQRLLERCRTILESAG